MVFVVLGGMKHCGKSTLGRIVAEDRGWAFHDLDDLILTESSGPWKSVRDLWRELGPEAFAALEEEAARNYIEWTMPALKKQGYVLSMGGGTIENSGAMAWISRKGTNVYIRADEELLYRRIMDSGRPPFLSEEDPRADFSALYSRRNVLYEQYAHLIHDVDDSPASINARRLLAVLEKHHAR